MRFSSKMATNRLKVMAILAALFIIPCPQVSSAGPIYVYREPSGSIRFSNFPPAKGVEAKVFTAKEAGFTRYKVGGMPYWARRGKARLFPNIYNPLIEGAAATHQVDSNLIKAVIHAESGFNPRAISPKGAQGLMQLMPDTARMLSVRNPFQPQDNIHGGAKFLAMLLKRFNGSLRLAIAGYNAGPEAVERYGGIPPYSETVNYVRRVLALREQYIRHARG